MGDPLDVLVLGSDRHCTIVSALGTSVPLFKFTYTETICFLQLKNDVLLKAGSERRPFWIDVRKWAPASLNTLADGNTHPRLKPSQA